MIEVSNNAIINTSAYNKEVGIQAQIPIMSLTQEADYSKTTKGMKAPYQSDGVIHGYLKEMFVNRTHHFKLCYFEDLSVPTYDRYKLFKYYGNGNNKEMVRFKAEKLTQTAHGGLAQPLYFMIKGNRVYLDQMLGLDDAKGDFEWDDKYSYGDTNVATTEEVMNESIPSLVVGVELDRINKLKDLIQEHFLKIAELIKVIHSL